jgi:hypothetical protein
MKVSHNPRFSSVFFRYICIAAIHPDAHEATPPPPPSDADVFDRSPMPGPSSLDDNPMPLKGPSPIPHRKRGRPRRQILAIETDLPEIEPRRKLRSQIPLRAATDDPWAILSKAPMVTPSSPNKPHKARHQAQKPVNDPSLSLQLHFSDYIQPGREQDAPKKRHIKS